MSGGLTVGTAAGRLDGAELAAGWAYGHDPLPAVAAGDVRDTLETVIAEALVPAGDRAHVAFSGGRDSSLVLALAVGVARRRGLPDPVPVVLRYPGVAESDEARWQELVLDRLGIGPARIVSVGEENGMAGPHARELLAAHGPYFPAGAHTSLPLAEAAAGGTVLTGEGGDLLLSPHRAWAAANAVARRGRVEPAAWRRALADAAPWPVRRRALQADADELPWLRPAARAAVRRLAADDSSHEPYAWGAATHWHAGARALAIGLPTVSAAYGLRGTRVVHPLFDPRVVSALAAAYGPLGPRSRTRVMRDVVGGSLPEAVLSRRSKAQFGAAVMTAATRALVQEWDGRSGLPRDLVDGEELRREWTRRVPSARSLPLLVAVVGAVVRAEVTP